MKLGFCADIGFIESFECIIDCDVEFDRSGEKLIINDVLDSTGKVSILVNDDEFFREFAFRIVKQAEADEKLLFLAVEQAVEDREAA